MAQQHLDFTVPGGDKIKGAFQKTEANVTELYSGAAAAAFAEGMGRTAQVVGYTPGGPATGAREALPKLLAYQFGNDSDHAGTNVSGAHALRLDQSRFQRLKISGNTTFTINGFPEANISDRGEFILLITFVGNTLRTVTFPASWKPITGSESFNNGFKKYVVRGIIVDGAIVLYEVKGHLVIDDSEFTHTLYMVGDLGEDSGPAFTQSMNYLAAKSMSYLLYAGDVNYPSGSASTIDAHTAPLNALIAAQKVLPCHGNHDLDTAALNFTLASTPMALGTVWKYSNSSATFSSAWKTVASTFSGWANVGGEVGKVPGFGETDSSTVPVVDDDSATYYFAKVLTLGSAPAAGTKARIKMYIDDGARVFINNLEVYNFQIEYPVSDASLAHAASGATPLADEVWSERTLHEILVDATMFTAGDNIIASEIHQNGTTSSDISWDMSIEFGTSTDVVPSKNDDVKFVNAYGQPLRNKFPYIESGLNAYKREIAGVCSIYVMNDGLNSAAKKTNPWTIEQDGRMHEWLKDKLAVDTNPFKIVMLHRACVSTYNSSSYWHSELNWPELKAPGIIQVFGHTHQTNLIDHESGLVLINASNSGGQAPRAIASLVGVVAGFTSTFADASTNYAVCRIDIGANFARIRFERTLDGSILYEATYARP